MERDGDKEGRGDTVRCTKGERDKKVRKGALWEATKEDKW